MPFCDTIGLQRVEMGWVGRGKGKGGGGGVSKNNAAYAGAPARTGPPVGQVCLRTVLTARLTIGKTSENKMEMRLRAQILPT